MGVHQRDGQQDVAQVLARLPAVLGDDVAEADDVFVRGLVEHECPDRHQRVEPAAGLVDGLADVLRRVGGLELLLAVRHVRVAQRGAGEGDRVDEGAVRIQVRQVPADQAAQLGPRADRGHVGVLAPPQRQWRAPVPRARQRPVDVVVQPVAVAAVLDVLGEPVGRLVLPQECVPDLGRADVPGRLRVVHQRRVAAPAVRVRVLEPLGPEQQATVLEVPDQDLVFSPRDLALR